MPTLHVHRLIAVVPQARIPAMATWYAANVDPNDNANQWPALNPSGLAADPVTHRWTNAALQDGELRTILGRVCALAAVTPPTAATWSGWTRAQKRAWLAGVRNQLLTNTGIYLALSDNDGAWDDPEAVLATLGLKRRQGP